MSRETAGCETGDHQTAMVERNRVIWHSRRGMLELDLILGPFAECRFPNLSASEQQSYVQLLACEDQDLFDWFLKKKPVGDSSLFGIVDAVLQYQVSRSL